MAAERDLQLAQRILDAGYLGHAQVEAALAEVDRLNAEGLPTALLTHLVEQGLLRPADAEALELAMRAGKPIGAVVAQPFTCPQCGHVYDVGGYAAGMRFICVTCSTPLTVPRQASSGAGAHGGAGAPGGASLAPANHLPREPAAPSVASIAKRAGVYSGAGVSPAIKKPPPDLDPALEFGVRFVSAAGLVLGTILMLTGLLGTLDWWPPTRSAVPWFTGGPISLAAARSGSPALAQLLSGAAFLAAGFGLAEYKPWARPLAGALGLVLIFYAVIQPYTFAPLGAFLVGVIVWALFTPKAGQQYSSR